MKNVMLGLAAAMAIAGSAVAADLPYRTAAPAPYFATTPYSWTGFYAGGTVGGLRADGQLEVPGTTFSQKVKPNGYSVGGFAGFQQQFGSVVAGVEADADYNKADRSQDLGFGATLNAKAPWAGSVRGRLGYTLTERTLVYATGGVALSNGFQYSIVAPGFAQSWKGSKVGYTAGAGVEYAFTDHVFGRLEGRYTNFGKQDETISGTKVTFKDDSYAVKAGVGYKF